jgi:hypothetical protein
MYTYGFKFTFLRPYFHLYFCRTSLFGLIGVVGYFACAVDFAFKRSFNLMIISTFVLYCFCSNILVVTGM